MTLKEVALKAGCSVATVSKALKNSSEISEDAKQRILTVAKEIGYFKKATTHTAILGGFKTVIFADAKGENAHLYGEIKSAAKKYGITVLYAEMAEKDGAELMNQIGAIGLIVGGNAKTKTEGKVFNLGDGLSNVSEFLKKAAEYMPARPSRAADPEKVTAKANKSIAKNKVTTKKPSAPKAEEVKKEEPAPAKKEEIWLL